LHRELRSLLQWLSVSFTAIAADLLGVARLIF
jgi:hypothetical protein